MFDFIDDIDIESIISDISNETDFFINNTLNEIENVIGSIETTANDVGLEITNFIDSLSDSFENFWSDIENFFSNMWLDIVSFLEELEFLIYVIPLVAGAIVAGLLIKKVIKIWLKVDNHRKLNAIYKNTKPQKKPQKSEKSLIKFWKSKFASIRKKINNNDSCKGIINFDDSKLPQIHITVQNAIEKIKNKSKKINFKLKRTNEKTNSLSKISKAPAALQVDNTDSIPPVVPPRSRSQTAPLQAVSSKKMARPLVPPRPTSKAPAALQVDNTDSIPPVVPPRSRSQTAPLQAVSSKKMARPLVPPKPKSWDEKNVNNINNLLVNNFELDQKPKSLHKKV